ncbi:MAG: TRAP transporter small permease [Candidatus Marinimicrobia bacterium]|nr:TRAP transporter small permease [Candidatus Neomarinimicrobiota bacterium]
MFKIEKYLNKVLEITLIVLMAASVVNVLWQVLTRFIMKNPSSYTEELARYLLIWVGLLGAGYAYGKKMHLAIDIVLLKLTGVWRQIVEIVIQVAVFCFASFVMVIGGVRLVSITLTLNQISAALRVPLGYVYSVLPLSGLIIMYFCVIFIRDSIRIIRLERQRG